ncbi:MAG: hypothetical protein ACI93H_001642, partial [Psychromonas sp.]
SDNDLNIISCRERPLMAYPLNYKTVERYL